jgi:hypothetical protein
MEEGPNSAWQSSSDFDEMLTEMEQQSSPSKPKDTITSKPTAPTPMGTKSNGRDDLLWSDSNVWA